MNFIIFNKNHYIFTESLKKIKYYDINLKLE